MTNLVTLYIFLTIVAILDLELDQLDVVSAFLNREIDIEVFLYQLEDIRLIIEYFCKLHKSIYRLYQGAKSWYMVLHDALTEDEFERLMSDLVYWIKYESKKYRSGKDLKAVSMLIAGVDDILTAGS